MGGRRGGGGEERGPCGVVVVFQAGCAELVSVRVLERGVLPLSLGFEE